MGYRSMLLVKDAVYLDLCSIFSQPPSGLLTVFDRILTPRRQDWSRTRHRALSSVSKLLKSTSTKTQQAHIWIGFQSSPLIRGSFWNLGHAILCLLLLLTLLTTAILPISKRVVANKEEEAAINRCLISGRILCARGRGQWKGSTYALQRSAASCKAPHPSG